LALQRFTETLLHIYHPQLKGGLLKELGDDYSYLGTVGLPPTTAVYLAKHPEGYSIVEPGPNSAANMVTRLVHEAGIPAEKVVTIAATHIHLDHAGASRALLEAYPRSRLHVYRGAAKHLADTTQLAASASQVLGPLFNIWGGIPSVDPARIDEHIEGDSVGPARLEVIYTPGHAPYHMSLFDRRSRVLLTGDAVGMYIKNKRTLWPASPLPSFRYDLELQTLRRIRELRPKQLLIPHYEPVTEVEDFLKLNLRIYEAWHDVISRVSDERDVDSVARKLVLAIDEYSWIPEEPHFWFTLKMHVAGFMEYEASRKA
jgi:glyoxylase-like metal-dependent hydrolase (beta-lactamase superfamily II)